MLRSVALVCPAVALARLNSVPVVVVPLNSAELPELADETVKSLPPLSVKPMSPAAVVEMVLPLA